MNKDNEIYKKALKHYHKSDIEKAIYVCDNAEESSLNSNILNFKGLLHYLKGEMNEARKLWNLNYQNNNDEISMKYLLDSKKDEDYALLFIQSMQYIKEMKISNAIEGLEVCKEKTNYNSINVNNELCKCYMKKAQYKKAIACIDAVLNLDKNNSVALKNKKTLISLGIIEKEKSKKVYVAISIMLFLLCGGLFYKFGINKKNINTASKVSEDKKESIKKDNKNNENVKNSIEENKDKQKIVENKKEVNNKEDKNINKENKKSIDTKKTFPSKELESFVKNEDYDKIHSILNEYTVGNLNINDKVIFNKAKEFMENKAGEHYYYKGRDFAKNNKFKEAIECYKKGIMYGKGMFPYEDNLYILGVSYNKTGNTEEALSIYERYFKEYKDKSYVKKGTYIKDVMYYLRNTYRNLGDNKYKFYEAELKKID